MSVTRNWSATLTRVESKNTSQQTQDADSMLFWRWANIDLTSCVGWDRLIIAMLDQIFEDGLPESASTRWLFAIKFIFFQDHTHLPPFAPAR